jgi:hypothetical protein
MRKGFNKITFAAFLFYVTGPFFVCILGPFVILLLPVPIILAIWGGIEFIVSWIEGKE